MISESTADVSIPLSKTKVVLVFLGAVGFVVGSFWIWFVADTQTRYSQLFAKAVAVVGASFFGLCSIYAFFKILDSRPGLMIDSQGIVDNSSAVAAGRIFWHEIIGLNVSEIAGQRFITIEVVDPKRFAEGGAFLRRTLNAVNTKVTGSPINISTNSLRLNFDQLVYQLTEAFEKYKVVG